MCVTTAAARAHAQRSAPRHVGPRQRSKTGLGWAVLGQDGAALCMGGGGLEDGPCCCRDSSLASSVAVLADDEAD